MNQEKIKVPGWFWAVAVLALIWNLMGVMAYLGQAMATPEMMESWPEDTRQMIENRPAWATAAFAIAVWGSTIACILLLLRRALSEKIFILAFIGIMVQMAYNLFVAEQNVDYGPGEIAMTIMIPAIGIYLIWVARKAKASGWLR